MSLGPCVGFGSIMIIEDTICYEVHDSRFYSSTGQTFNFDTILWSSGQISLKITTKLLSKNGGKNAFGQKITCFYFEYFFTNIYILFVANMISTTFSYNEFFNQKTKNFEFGK